MKKYCYICGKDKSEFERDSDGFYNHTERDHQAWSYVYFMFYLEN